MMARWDAFQSAHDAALANPADRHLAEACEIACQEWLNEASFNDFCADVVMNARALGQALTTDDPEYFAECVKNLRASLQGVKDYRHYATDKREPRSYWNYGARVLRRIRVA